VFVAELARDATSSFRRAEATRGGGIHDEMGLQGIRCRLVRRNRNRIWIAAGIALAIIAVVNGLGAKLNAKFASINSSLK
jgi:hypothetical protein